jgi:polyisoprenoid-binding protein YceI
MRGLPLKNPERTLYSYYFNDQISGGIMKSIFAVLLFVLAISPMSFAAKYKLDKAHSEVGFKIKHLAISTVKGKFKDFNGSFEFDDKTGKLENLKATMDAASIDTNEPKRDEHLRSPDFFDAKKYPTIEFVATKVENSGTKPTKVHGNLTMHGVTKPVTLDVDYKGVAKDPWGNYRTAFEATGKVNRKDFGLKWNKTLETGGLLVGDEVQIEIAGEATQENEVAPTAAKKDEKKDSKKN